jgi:hypothetical protein
MKGFKVTLPDGSAKKGTDKIIYAVGQEYKMLEDAVICKRGFHFCTKPADCFTYYDFNSCNLMFEVEALGNISTEVNGDSKVATNHLKVIRQIEWAEMLELCNDGKNNTGLRNTGNNNTGYRNTGDNNTGNNNTGYNNTGNNNTGDNNTGDNNTGYGNTGDRNTGNYNTGNYNTGNSNTGFANKGNKHTGAFCTGEANFNMFNKLTDMNYNDFISSKAYSLLCQVNTKKWISSSEMTDEQKKLRPYHEVQGGMYVDVPFNVSFSEKWEKWTAKKRGEFTNLPNFDANIFFEITGVKI